MSGKIYFKIRLLQKEIYLTYDTNYKDNYSLNKIFS